MTEPNDSVRPEPGAGRPLHERIYEAVRQHFILKGDGGPTKTEQWWDWLAAYLKREIEDAVREALAARDKEWGALNPVPKDDAERAIAAALAAKERELAEVRAIVGACGHEKDELRAKANAAEARRSVAEHRAQRIVLDAELKAENERLRAELSAAREAGREARPAGAARLLGLATVEEPKA